MGFLKKVTKSISKALGNVTGAVGALVGAKAAPTQVQEAAEVAQAPSAQAVDVPKETDIQNDDDSTSESAKRKLNSSGKRSLSIARSSGTGINI